MKRKVIKIFIILMVLSSCEDDNQTIIITEEQDTFIMSGCLPPTIPGNNDTSIRKEINMDTGIFDYVQELPEYIGGEHFLNKFISENLKYPKLAIENNIEGKVFVGFIVEKNGNISDINIVGKKILGYGLEEEAIRIVKLIPKWNAGKQNGKLVRVRYSLPINFKLEK